MDYHPYSDGARLTPGSVILLFIFVAAAAFLVTAVLWRPWFGDGPAPVAAPAIEAPAGELVGADVAPAPADQVPTTP